jgi:hypothetical protein
MHSDLPHDFRGWAPLDDVKLELLHLHNDKYRSGVARLAIRARARSLAPTIPISKRGDLTFALTPLRHL